MTDGDDPVHLRPAFEHRCSRWAAHGRWLMLCAACSRPPLPGDPSMAGDDDSSAAPGDDPSGEPGGQGPADTESPAPVPGSTTGDTTTSTASGHPGSTGTGDDLGGTTAEPDKDSGTTDEPVDDLPVTPGPDSPLPLDPLCGNGVLDAGETCDDGNNAPGDGCLPDCRDGMATMLPPGWKQEPPSWAEQFVVLGGTLFGLPTGAFVVGGNIWDSPDRLELAPLQPDGPAAWSHAEADHRSFGSLTTASNGDILVADFEHPPVPGAALPLWLTRLSPTGSVLWSHGYEPDPDEHGVASPELAVTPGGDIVVVRTSSLRVVDAAGVLRWTRRAPEDAAWSVEYTAVAVDGQGRIFVGGERRPTAAPGASVHLEALDADGELLWQTGLKSPEYGYTSHPSLMVGADGALFVAMGHSDPETDTGGGSLAAYDPAGALQWWRDSPETCCIRHVPSAFVSAPAGGFFVLWAFMGDDSGWASVVRYNADGTYLYTLGQVQGWVKDFRPGPDGRYYSLEANHFEDDHGLYLVPHLP